MSVDVEQLVARVQQEIAQDNWQAVNDSVKMLVVEAGFRTEDLLEIDSNLTTKLLIWRRQCGLSKPQEEPNPSHASSCRQKKTSGTTTNSNPSGSAMYITDLPPGVAPQTFVKQSSGRDNLVCYCGAPVTWVRTIWKEILAVDGKVLFEYEQPIGWSCDKHIPK